MSSTDDQGPKKAPREADMGAGRRLRELRLVRGLSQAKLAAAVGVSFQQVQKYEKGRNRISSSRLERVAEFFGVAADAFFSAEANPVETASVQAAVNEQNALITPEVMLILRAFNKIQNKEVRYHLLGLARALSKPQDERKE